MPEKVVIPISVFDYSSDYVRPVVAIWMDRASLVQNMFNALVKWNLDIDNVEPITTGKPSEQGITIRLPEKRSSFFFGPANCRFTRDTASWNTAHETAEILQTFLSILLDGTGVELQNQKTALIMHLQPSTKKFMDLLKPFLPQPLQEFSEGDITSGASVVKWKDSRITLDGSNHVANGLYLKYEREFGNTVSFETIALDLRAAEDKLFQILDVEEDI